MSSFVIDKREYVKAAGFYNGIVSDTPTAAYDGFIILYELNAKSVALQYGDDQPENDEKSYIDDFTDYFFKGRKLRKSATTDFMDKIILEESIFNLSDFFSSVMYQIEQPELLAEAEQSIFRMEHNLLQALINASNYDSDCWGSFEIASLDE